MTQKHCCKCKMLLELSNFGKLKNTPDGYRYDCKDCRKQYRLNNAEQIYNRLVALKIEVNLIN